MSRILLVATVLFLACLTAIGQPTPPGNPPPGPGAPVPISGIEWLLAAGALFGSGKLLVRKLNKTKF